MSKVCPTITVWLIGHHSYQDISSHKPSYVTLPTKGSWGGPAQYLEHLLNGVSREPRTYNLPSPDGSLVKQNLGDCLPATSQAHPLVISRFIPPPPPPPPPAPVPAWEGTIYVRVRGGSKRRALEVTSLTLLSSLQAWAKEEGLPCLEGAATTPLNPTLTLERAGVKPGDTLSFLPVAWTGPVSITAPSLSTSSASLQTRGDRHARELLKAALNSLLPALLAQPTGLPFPPASPPRHPLP